MTDVIVEVSGAGRSEVGTATEVPAPFGHRPRVAPAGLRDHRVAELERAVRAERTSVLSLDCFDTVLWRRVPKPTDLFVVLGEELAAAGHLSGHVSPVVFGRLRVAAEHAARRRRSLAGAVPEVNLEDIYRELPPDVADLPSADLRRAEIDLERRLTVPDPLLAEAVTALAGDAGLDVVVVSDFYFCADDLRVLLDRPELGAIAGARIVTSADAGIGKESGLWHVLPAQFGVEPGAIVHVGNNARADLEAPRAAGVRTVFWADRTDHLHRVLDREARRAAPATPAAPAAQAATDDGVTALRGRAIFAAPTAPSDVVAWETGTSVLGPVVAGYADWVQQRTAALGITRALCIMREGRFLDRVLSGAIPHGPNPALRCRLLWASREALVRASLADRELPDVEAALSEPTAATVPRAAASLGIDLDALPAFRQLVTDAPHLEGDPAALHVFLETVWRTPELRQLVRATTERRRRNFVRHLREALGDEPGEVALLDLGWRGSCQERLQSIIDAEGLGVRLHGLYLSAELCPDDRRLRGHRIEGFLPDPPTGTHDDVERFRRNQCGLLELLFTSDDGMTLEIGDDGQPVCATYQPPPTQRRQRRVVQDGVLAYLEHLLAYRASSGSATLATAGARTAEAILQRFTCAPTEEEARCFGAWEFEDDHDGHERSSLVPGDDGLLRRMTADQLHDQPWERVFWPAGALAHWQGPAPDPATGPLSPAGALRLQLQRGTGTPDPPGIAYLRLGHDGASFATWAGDGTDVHRITILPTLVSGILRLDDLQVVMRSITDTWRRPVWTWRAGEDTSRLQLTDGQWIAPNLANLTPQSAFTIELPQPLPGRSQVAIGLSGAFLAFADGSARITTGPDGNAQLAFQAR